MRVFTIKLVCAALLSFGLSVGLYYKFSDHLFDLAAIGEIFFMFVITYLSYSLVVKASTKNDRQFVTYFMGAFGGKFLFSIAFLSLMLYLNKNDRLPLAFTFGISYLLMTVVEVIQMVKLVRNSSTDSAN